MQLFIVACLEVDEHQKDLADGLAELVLVELDVWDVLVDAEDTFARWMPVRDLSSVENTKLPTRNMLSLKLAQISSTTVRTFQLRVFEGAHT